MANQEKAVFVQREAEVAAMVAAVSLRLRNDLITQEMLSLMDSLPLRPRSLSDHSFPGLRSLSVFKRDGRFLRRPRFDGKSTSCLS